MDFTACTLAGNLIRGSTPHAVKASQAGKQAGREAVRLARPPPIICSCPLSTAAAAPRHPPWPRPWPGSHRCRSTAQRFWTARRRLLCRRVRRPRPCRPACKGQAALACQHLGPFDWCRAGIRLCGPSCACHAGAAALASTAERRRVPPLEHAMCRACASRRHRSARATNLAAPPRPPPAPHTHLHHTPPSPQTHTPFPPRQAPGRNCEGVGLAKPWQLGGDGQGRGAARAARLGQQNGVPFKHRGDDCRGRASMAQRVAGSLAFASAPVPLHAWTCSARPPCSLQPWPPS